MINLSPFFSVYYLHSTDPITERQRMMVWGGPNHRSTKRKVFRFHASPFSGSVSWSDPYRAKNVPSKSWSWNYPFSHNHGSGKLPQMKGNDYWRDLFFTSMIMGGRVSSPIVGPEGNTFEPLERSLNDSWLRRNSRHVFFSKGRNSSQDFIGEQMIPSLWKIPMLVWYYIQCNTVIQQDFQRFWFYGIHFPWFLLGANDPIWYCTPYFLSWVWVEKIPPKLDEVKNVMAEDPGWWDMISSGSQLTMLHNVSPIFARKKHFGGWFEYVCFVEVLNECDTYREKLFLAIWKLYFSLRIRHTNHNTLYLGMLPPPGNSDHQDYCIFIGRSLHVNIVNLNFPLLLPVFFRIPMYTTLMIHDRRFVGFLCSAFKNIRSWNIPLY